MTLPTNGAGRRRSLLPPPEPRDRETQRELAKLTAGYLNGIAISVFAIGGLAPAVASVSNAASAMPGLAFAATGLISFVFSTFLHFVARRMLRKGYSS